MSVVLDRPDTEVTANTEYIQGLSYDLNQLLAVDLTPAELDPASAGETRAHEGGRVVIVTKRLHDASSRLTENLLLNPAAGVVFPGALVKQDRSLAEGMPTPYTLSRRPIRLRVDLPGLEERGVVEVERPTAVSVDLAIQKIVDTWFQDVQHAQGYQPPMRAFSESHTAYSKEQIGVECGFGAQWGRSQATAGLKVGTTGDETVVYRVFKQIYFSVVVEEPDQAGLLFGPGVSLGPVNMPPSAPPGLVRCVDYGRLIVVQMSTQQHVTAQEAEATLDYKSQGLKVSAEMQERYDRIARASSFRVLVLGGGGDSVADLVAGDVDAMSAAISKGIEFSKTNLAHPIAYMVADLRSRATSQIRSTTRYVETVREVLADHTVTMRHTGGFVASFNARWEQYDEAAKKFMPAEWHSGDHTAPYEAMLQMRGDVRNLVVEGRYAIFIKTWRSKFKSYDCLTSDRTIRLSGTTLNAHLDD